MISPAEPAGPAPATAPASRRWPMTRGFPAMGAYVHAPAAVRWQVRETLSGWGLVDLADTGELVASEIAANAVAALADPETVSGENPRGLPRVIAGTVAAIAVRLRSDGVFLLIEVWDPADGKPERRDAGPDDESGRGLAIVDALCEARGCDPHPNGGKVVWALLKHPHPSGTSQRTGRPR